MPVPATMRPRTCAGLPPSLHEPAYSARSPCQSTFHGLQLLLSARDRNPLTGDIGSATSWAVMQKRPIRFAAMPPERVNSQVPGCIGLVSAVAGSAVKSPNSIRPVFRIEMSDDHQVDEFVHRCCCQLLGIQAQFKNQFLLLGGEAARQIDLELFHQYRHAFAAAAFVADRIL